MHWSGDQPADDTVGLKWKNSVVNNVCCMITSKAKINDFRHFCFTPQKKNSYNVEFIVGYNTAPFPPFDPLNSLE